LGFVLQPFCKWGDTSEYLRTSVFWKTAGHQTVLGELIFLSRQRDWLSYWGYTDVTILLGGPYSSHNL